MMVSSYYLVQFTDIVVARLVGASDFDSETK